MNISKYKKLNNGSYNIYLEDGRVLSLYEEVILSIPQYEILFFSLNNHPLSSFNIVFLK